jgi:hypothetical protein
MRLSKTKSLFHSYSLFRVSNDLKKVMPKKYSNTCNIHIYVFSDIFTSTQYLLSQANVTRVVKSRMRQGDDFSTEGWGGGQLRRIAIIYT